MDLDTGMSAADAVLSSRDIDDVGLEAHGVVVADHASVLEAEELVEPTVLGPGDPRRVGVLRCDHEAVVVAREAALEDLVGIAHRAGFGQAHLTDEAVLEGSPQPL